MKEFMDEIVDVLESHKGALSEDISDKKRKQILDGLGEAGSTFRDRIYNTSFVGKKQEIAIPNLLQLMEICQQYVQHTIRANKRSDNLYHS